MVWAPLVYEATMLTDPAERVKEIGKAMTKELTLLGMVGVEAETPTPAVDVQVLVEAAGKENDWYVEPVIETDQEYKV